MIRPADVKWRVWQAWLWCASTWWFQLAHKPLCERFSRDVLTIGKWRVCRSCAVLYSGVAAAGVALAILCPPSTPLLVLFFGIALPTMVVSYPPAYRHFGRRSRDAIRLAAGVSISLWVFLLFFGHFFLAVVVGAGLLACIFHYLSKRNASKRLACDGCDEFGTGGVCSGYAQQAESIRAYSLCVEESLNRDGVVPPAIRSD